MKKNASNSRPGTVSGSRAPSTVNRDYRAARVQSETYKTNRAPAPKKSSKKNNGGKVFGICAAVLLLLVGGVGSYFFFSGNTPNSVVDTTTPTAPVLSNDKYSVTLADGTIAELTATEMKNELMNANFYQNISVDGIDLSGKTKDEAVALVSSKVPSKPENVNITLNLDGNDYPLDLSTLSVESNYNDVINEAYAFSRPAETASEAEIVNCYKAYQILKTTPKSYETSYTINTDGLDAAIHDVLDPLDTPLIEATITKFNVNTLQFEATESKDGYEINIDKAISDAKSLIESGKYEGTIAVEAEVTKPTLSYDDVLNGYGLVSESSSTTTSNNSRNHNIRITCEKIDGLLLMPGESFSFNDFVGQRTPEAGYELAGTIQDGKTELGYGGGICQLSTMIYQSVVKADLQVDERWPHQWPSSYAETGTDAAVDWGSQDFKFTNNSPYPIALHSTYDIDNRIVKVQLYSKIDTSGSYIVLVGEVLSRSSATTEYVANSSMATGTSERTRDAHDGISATSYKVYYDANGNEIKREQYKDSYYAKINARVEIGVLNADGSIATMDPSTGAITSANTTDPSDTSESSTEVTESTEMTVPSDTTVAPVVTDPVITDPVVTEPLPTEPVVTEPVVTEPVVTEPIVTEPVATEPIVTEPVVTDPPATEPVVTDPPVYEEPPVESMVQME